MKDHKTGEKDPQTKKAITKQTRLVIVSLKEAYAFFKDKNPGVKVGFAKFAELRPKECLLADQTGTHSVCVCTIHQNTKLMIEGTKLPQLTAKSKTPINTYHDCFNYVLCKFTNKACWLGHCPLCPPKDELHNFLTSIFEATGQTEVTYTQWVSTDRSEIRTITEPTNEFINKFCDKLLLLRKHSFVSKKQSASFSKMKDNLQEGEVLVQGDFSENYKIVVQDESQSFHWNNKQVTLHPFVCYYRGSDNEIKHVSYVPISEFNKHDTTAVYMFQEKLIKFLKETINFDIKKIFYFSDGCAGQYKNCKNFYNLCYHKADFGIEAEWHFFATSHGKGACDGVGGILKRLVRKESLKRLYKNQITTAWDFFQYLKHNVDFPSGLTVEYFHEQTYKEIELFLQSRYAEANTIPQTRKYHCYRPISKNKLLVKEFSEDDVEIEVSVTGIGIEDTVKLDLKQDDYVTVVYDDQWWLGKVESETDEEGMVGVSFFRPAGSERVRTFTKPPKEDFLPVPLEDVLMVVVPLTRKSTENQRKKSSRTTELSPADIKRSCELLLEYDR